MINHHLNQISSLSSAVGIFDCFFEEDFCLWQQDPTDQADWERTRGSTSTSDTGPTGDHTTGGLLGELWCFCDCSQWTCGNIFPKKCFYYWFFIGSEASFMLNKVSVRSYYLYVHNLKESFLALTNCLCQWWPTLQHWRQI